MNSVIEDIRSMLEADSGLGLTFATNLFLYKEPATPDNTVTLFETPGMPPIGLLNADTDTKHYERPAFQVRIRNKTAQGAFELAYQIQTVLHGTANVTQGAYYYGLIAVASSAEMMDWDNNDRIHVVLNFLVQRRLT